MEGGEEEWVGTGRSEGAGGGGECDVVCALV